MLKENLSQVPTPPSPLCPEEAGSGASAEGAWREATSWALSRALAQGSGPAAGLPGAVVGTWEAALTAAAGQTRAERGAWGCKRSGDQSIPSPERREAPRAPGPRPSALARPFGPTW